MAISNISIDRTNRIEAIGSPCLAPLPRSMSLSRLPAWLIWLLKPFRRIFTQVCMTIGKPAVSITFSMKEKLTESKAFSKSIDIIIPFLPLVEYAS